MKVILSCPIFAKDSALEGILLKNVLRRAHCHMTSPVTPWMFAEMKANISESKNALEAAIYQRRKRATRGAKLFTTLCTQMEEEVILESGQSLCAMHSEVIILQRNGTSV